MGLILSTTIAIGVPQRDRMECRMDFRLYLLRDHRCAVASIEILPLIIGGRDCSSVWLGDHRCAVEEVVVCVIDVGWNEPEIAIDLHRVIPIMGNLRAMKIALEPIRCDFLEI